MKSYSFVFNKANTFAYVYAFMYANHFIRYFVMSKTRTCLSYDVRGLRNVVLAIE